MWSFSKHSRRMANSNAKLQSQALVDAIELRRLTQRLLNVQDEERRKLARDLHDTTGQTLAALKISISFLQEKLESDPEKLAAVFAIEALADQSIQEIRTMSYLLHPPLLDEVGFHAAAEWYIEGFAKRSGINVSVDIASRNPRLPDLVEIALFRVLQECLTNIHRHSGAPEASVSLQRHDTGVVLEVRDTGRGIPAERLARLRGTSADTGVGLAGMRERMHELNGSLEMESDSSGTSMRAFVPLPAMPHPAQHPVRTEIALSPGFASAS
jgi:two-component system, NarL family, sensor kinase